MGTALSNRDAGVYITERYVRHMQITCLLYGWNSHGSIIIIIIIIISIAAIVAIRACL
jgi:hypothetical protein